VLGCLKAVIIENLSNFRKLFQYPKMDQPYIEPLYLMQFSVDADVVDIIWVLERMVKRKAEGGAELLIQCRNPTQDKVCHLI
jgi:hypothetical protein